jgi:hypothetical protein
MNEEYKNDKCNGKCLHEVMQMKEFNSYKQECPERKGILSWLRTPITITFAEAILIGTSLLWLVRKELDAVIVGAMPYGNLLVALTVFLVLTYRKRR